MLGGFFRIAAHGAGDAAAHVILEHEQAGLPGGSDDGRELGEHVETVLILFDHPLHAAHLAFHAAQAGEDLRFVMGIGGRAPRLSPNIVHVSVREAHQCLRVCDFHTSIIPQGGNQVKVRRGVNDGQASLS